MINSELSIAQDMEDIKQNIQNPINAKALISVIIPIYNVEQYIDECIKSVINQTYKNLEIICIDDCSCDNSIKTLEEYITKDKRIKLIKHEKNLGLAVSRNTGLAHAKGEYIFFLDSDDYINLDIIEKLYNKIITDKSDVVSSSAKAFTKDDDKNIVERVDNYNNEFQKLSKEGKIQINFGNFDLFDDILFHTAWGRLYKSEFLKKNNITIINKNIICEDEGYFVKIMSHFPLVSFIQDIGVMYRIRKNSIISKNLDNKDSQKQKTKQLKIVLEDALKHIKQTNNTKRFKKLKDQIKKSELYGNCFDINFSNLIKIILRKDNKRIKIFYINLYREKVVKNNIKIYKVLGITIKKEKIKSVIQS